MIIYLSSISILCSTHLPWLDGIEEDQRSRFQFWLRSVGIFKQVQWILCTSFNQLEGPIMSTFPKKAGICLVGHLISASSTNGSDHLLKHVSLWEETNKYLQWLDEQTREFVIYIYIESTICFNGRKVEELAPGLEATQRPFLWVVHPDIIDISPSNTPMLPCVYLERIRNRGCVISWAP